MEIIHIAHSAFRIKSKNAAIITDPFTKDASGTAFPKKFSAEIVTVSHDHDDHNNVSAVEGDPFTVRGSGEYEIKGIGIVGISLYHDPEKGQKRGKNTAYRFDVDGVHIVHLGDLGHVLSSDQADSLDGVDVLMVPVGGIYTIGPKEAAQVVKEISPSYVIPMHYLMPGFDSGVFAELRPVTEFLEAMGTSAITPVEKLSVDKESVSEELQVVQLIPKHSA